MTVVAYHFITIQCCNVDRWGLSPELGKGSIASGTSSTETVTAIGLLPYSDILPRWPIAHRLYTPHSDLEFAHKSSVK